MFIKTRQGRLGKKGKVIDEETLDAIVSLFVLMKCLKVPYILLVHNFDIFGQSKLQSSIENSSAYGESTFESVFGKEKYGEVRCYGRTVTPTTLKKNQEIDALK